MAVHTFSTQSVKKPEDTRLIEAIKEYCDKHKLNFSQIVIALLREEFTEKLDGR